MKRKIVALVLGALVMVPVLTASAEAAGGCGPYRHRGPWGGCRPGGQFGYRGGGFHRGYHYHYHYHYHYR